MNSQHTMFWPLRNDRSNRNMQMSPIRLKEVKQIFKDFEFAPFSYRPYSVTTVPAVFDQAPCFSHALEIC